MGYDTLSIVSMNSARQGLFSLPRQSRSSYMGQLLNNIHPDIGVLPGDNPELKNGVVRGYGQYLAPNNEDTMLLYDSNKVNMTKQMMISDSIFNDLQYLDSLKLVWPNVEVSTLKPAVEVVKRFSMITFHYTMFSEQNKKVKEVMMDQLTVFAHRLALVTGQPILIAGEIRLSYSAVRSIVTQVNQRTQQQYLTNEHAFLQAFTGVDYTPSMTKGATREGRDLFKLEPIACRRKDPIVKTWEEEIQADCFIASKALEMTEPTGIAIEQVMGQQVKMTALKESCVTKSCMQIPVRPPRQHGG